MKNITNQNVKIERWIERGTKAWECLTHPFPSGFLAGHTIKEMVESATNPHQLFSRYSAPHPPSSYTLLHSVFCFIFWFQPHEDRPPSYARGRQGGYSLYLQWERLSGRSSFLSPYLIDRLMIVVFSYRSLWAISVGWFVPRSDRYPLSGGKVWRPFQRGLCIGGPSCGSSSALSGYGISVPESTLTGGRGGLTPGTLRVFWEFLNNLLTTYPAGKLWVIYQFAHHFDFN